MPMPARRKRPALATKTQPAQQRAAETFERILAVTAELLADVGFERLSTNLVCERAGLTPPALYRYFPNKYALLYELAMRLMRARNELIGQAITLEVFTGPIEQLEQVLEDLVVDTYQLTARTTGGVWITRALRAVPVLQEIRLGSHTAVTKQQAQLLAYALPGVKPAELLLVSRIAVDLLYATVEMLFDEPLEPRAAARIAAGMVASQMTRMRSMAKSARRRAR